MGAQIDFSFSLRYCTRRAQRVTFHFTTLLGAAAPPRNGDENENHSHLETVAQPRPFLAVFSKNGCGGTPSLC